VTCHPGAASISEFLEERDDRVTEDSEASAQVFVPEHSLSSLEERLASILRYNSS
jgi:hypothetical protein